MTEIALAFLLFVSTVNSSGAAAEAPAAPEQPELTFFGSAVPKRSERPPVVVIPPGPQKQSPFKPPDRDPAANGPRYYACPNDGAELRVPSASASAKFKCPLDGAEMRAAVGQNRRFYLLEEYP